MSSKLLKKLSAKHIIGNVKEFVAKIDKDGGELEAYRVFGKIVGIRSGQSTFGDWIMFKGQIEAISYDGETFRATEVAIQEPMQTMLQSALAEHDSVEFAMVVSVKRRDDLEVGYEYIVSPLVEAQEDDALAHLRQAALPPAEKPNKRK